MKKDIINDFCLFMRKFISPQLFYFLVLVICIIVCFNNEKNPDPNF